MTYKFIRSKRQHRQVHAGYREILVLVMDDADPDQWEIIKLHHVSANHPWKPEVCLGIPTIESYIELVDWLVEMNIDFTPTRNQYIFLRYENDYVQLKLRFS